MNKYKLSTDKKCIKCLTEAINNLNDDIRKLGDIERYEFIDISNIVNDDRIHEIFKNNEHIDINKLYSIITSIPISYKYNKILHNIFISNNKLEQYNINSKSINIDIMNNDYYQLVFNIKSELKYYINTFIHNDELEDIYSKLSINNNYLIKLFTKDITNKYQNSNDKEVIKFTNILNILNKLMEINESTIIDDNIKCLVDVINSDFVIFDDDDIEKFCDQHRIKNYSENRVIISKNLQEYINKYFNNHIDYNLDMINQLNNDDKMNILSYLATLLYNFFDDLLRYIVINHKLSYISKYRTNIYKDLKFVVDDNKYNNIDINKTNYLINKIENKHPDLELYGKYLTLLFNINKNNFMTINSIMSLNLLFIIKYKIYDKNNREMYHIIDDGDEIINKLNYNGMKNYKFIEQSIEFIWNYYSDTNGKNYYEIDNNSRDNIIDDLYDYFVILYFAKFNYEISKDNIMNVYIDIVKEYLSNYLEIDDINEIKDDKYEKNIYDINIFADNTSHSTLLFKINDKYIYFDPNYTTYQYINDYMKSLFRNNYEHLSLELKTIEKGIQNSEDIYGESFCVYSSRHSIINETYTGFCASWSFYFKLIFLMNIDKINNYDDLVNLLRKVALNENNSFSDYTKIENQYKLLKSMLIQLYILYNHDIIKDNIINEILVKDTSYRLLMDIFDEIQDNINNNDDYEKFRNI